MNALPTPPTDPRPSPQGDDAAQVIDTSKMNAGQRAALEMTESARDAASEKGSFAANLFMGRYELGRLLPYPVQTPRDRDQGDAFLAGYLAGTYEGADADEALRRAVASGAASTRLLGAGVLDRADVDALAREVVVEEVAAGA